MRFETWLEQQSFKGVSNHDLCLSWFEMLFAELQNNYRRHESCIVNSKDTLLTDWARISLKLIDIDNLKMRLLYVFYLSSVKQDNDINIYPPSLSSLFIKQYKSNK